MNNESSNPELPKEVLLGTPGPLPKLHIDLDPSDPAALLFSSAIESTDDSPTIVSRTVPQLVKPVESNLRLMFSKAKSSGITN